MYFIQLDVFMKNYYQVLEVNENASPEVIEKAYKVLAKKYHPDSWPSEKSYWAEDRFKEITEAYQTLSNTELRKSYDMQIGINNSFESKYTDLYNENEKLKQEVNSMKIRNKSKEYKENSEKNQSTSYFKRYSTTIKNLIHSEINKTQEERSKDLKALLLTIVIISILIFVFWKVPFLHNLIFP